MIVLSTVFPLCEDRGEGWFTFYNCDCLLHSGLLDFLDRLLSMLVIVDAFSGATHKNRCTLYCSRAGS